MGNRTFEELDTELQKAYSNLGVKNRELEKALEQIRALKAHKNLERKFKEHEEAFLQVWALTERIKKTYALRS